ncbi:MAG: Gfo/Idh/MocA family oxidoreductase, partial [Synechococcaceae cyanobacterium]|nr:Gfo/Idh/MocA family oxidoreductase [Synechococcaceae cyanobacterium]
MIRVAVIGFGYWGPNFVRVLRSLPDCDVIGVVDSRPEALQAAGAMHPGLGLFATIDELLEVGVDAVVVATPASTHFEIASRLLDAGIDLLVEKPLALSVEDGLVLAEKAEAKRRVLMVGHLLEYHPGLVQFRDMVRSGDLGDLYYLYTTRVNLGKVRAAESVLWDLAPHDVSTIHFLTDAAPVHVSAQGGSYVRPGLPDVVFATITFEGGIVGNVHVSWLDPHKVRRVTVVGNRRMAVFDDMEPVEKIRIIDKGIDTTEHYESFQDAITERIGDIRIPPVRSGEPLKVEAQHFLDCVQDRTAPRTDVRSGIRVLAVLEAMEA